MEMLTAEAFLTAYWNEHEAFPPYIVAFLPAGDHPNSYDSISVVNA